MSGKLIDPIGETPANRNEKNIGETPAGKRRIRPPLYEDPQISAPATSKTFETVKEYPQVLASDVNIELKNTSMIESDFKGSLGIGDPEEVSLDAGKLSLDNIGDSTNDAPYNTTNTSSSYNSAYSYTNNLNVSQNSAFSSKTALEQSKEKLVIQLPKKDNSFGKEKNTKYTILFSGKSLKPRSRKVLIENSDCHPAIWSIKQVGPVNVKKELDSYLITDTIFRVNCTKGKINGGDSKEVVFSFSPLFNANYSVLFQIRTNGTILEIYLEGCTTDKNLTNSGIAPGMKNESLNPRLLDDNIDLHINDILEKERKLNRPTPEPATTIDKANSYPAKISQVNGKVSVYSIALTPKRDSYKLPENLECETTPINYSISARLNDTLNFGCVPLHCEKVMQLKINNVDTKNVLVQLAVTGSFSIPLREILMTARSYVIIPIRLDVIETGPISERLIIKRGDKVKRIRLIANSL
jgi:hypothetical protein